MTELDEDLISNKKLRTFLKNTIMTTSLATLTAAQLQALVVANGLAECTTDAQRRTIRLLAKQIILDNKRNVLAAQTTLKDGGGRRRASPAKRTPKAKKKTPSKPRKKAVATQKMSPELLAVCGEETSNRFTITKLVWAYVKKHDLQDPDNKRTVVCDEKLKAVFGVDKLNGFSMSKHWSRHLTDIE